MDTTLADPLIGRVVDDRYRVVARLAAGGMATVYEAVDLRLERTVALKVMRASLAEDADFVARFVREARSAARLSHPNVVSVYDQGTDGELVFLVMEYVPSLNLREVLRERGHLTVQETFDVIEPVLSALAAAHAAGIVHRDVKPENVLLAQDGRVLVADFGLARTTSSVTSATTQGILIGTVAYLSPEQVDRGIADPRSDVYAAGIVLYEMLTGAPPFAGETPMSVAYQHVNGVVPPPSQAVDGIPAPVDALVVGATEREADNRYSDASRFLDAVRATRSRIGLAPARGGASTTPRSLTDTLVVPRRGTPATPAAGGAIATPNHPTSALPREEADSGVAPRKQKPPRTPVQQRRRRRRRGLVVIVLILAVAAAIGFYAYDAGSARYVATPAVADLTQDQAGAKIRAAGLTPVAGKKVFSETVARGRVISTSPGGGERARTDSNVVMTISKGPERYDVPKLKGRTEAEAKAAVRQASLSVGTVDRRYSDTVKNGVVISNSPVAGTSVKRDTVVDFVVSKGPAPVKVPNLVGSTQTAAAAKLSSLGLKVGKVSQEYSDTVAKGTVISQSPTRGAQLERGDAVGMVVSKGPPLVTVPNVFGKSVASAERTLKAAGFAVNKQALLGGLLGVVQSQSPGGGSQQPRGSTITIRYV